LRRRTVGKRRKRKIFRTPEEREAWLAHYERNMMALEWHFNRIEAELEAKGQLDNRPPSEFPDWRRDLRS